MDICYRKAVKTDEPAIRRLFVEMLCTINGTTDEEGYEDGAIDYYFADGENRIFAVEANGTVIGFLSVEVHHEEVDFLYYDDFCITAEYRSQGIGSALMELAEEYAKNLDISTIHLHVAKSNYFAKQFYEKRGFTLLRDDGTRDCLHKRLSYNQKETGAVVPVSF